MNWRIDSIQPVGEDILVQASAPRGDGSGTQTTVRIPWSIIEILDDWLKQRRLA